MNSENPVVSVIGSCVLVGGVAHRLVEFADGSGRVESFVNGAWVPGGCTVKELLMGTPCADPERYAEGIAFARNAPLGISKKIARPLLELLDGPWTWVVPVVTVLVVATLLYFVRHDLTALPW